MEFNYNINEIFKSPIVEINHSLIPPGYTGDRRALRDVVTKVSDIVNAMGEASAAAQGLTKPVTTADRLRNSEHKLYFLIDSHANGGRGAVTGMLKTGNKSLYVFDREGTHYQVAPPCLLDFYIHESRQRTGLGKQLFEYMLHRETVEPVQMAIDRPSEKLLGFFKKHYHLSEPVKQMNNYVVYDGFFPSKEHITPPEAEVEDARSVTSLKKNSANGLQAFQVAPLGRYGAPRPPCSMGQIIHNQSTVDQRKEPAGDVQNSEVIQPSPVQKLERPRSLIIQQELVIQQEEPRKEDEQVEEKELEDLGNDSPVEDDAPDSLEVDLELKLKLHEGEKIKVKGTTECFLHGDEDGPSPRKTPSHLTDQGYFDLKFYHNKLW